MAPAAALVLSLTACVDETTCTLGIDRLCRESSLDAVSRAFADGAACQRTDSAPIILSHALEYTPHCQDDERCLTFTLDLAHDCYTNTYELGWAEASKACPR